MRRLDERGHRAVPRLLDRLWAEFEVVEADDLLVTRAAELAKLAALRGYHAVHCAAEADLVVASGDHRLLIACAGLGMATADTNAA
jgi:hypothetical protein